MSTELGTIAPAAAWARAPGALRRFAAVFVAGGIAGLIAGGLGSRVAMRIAAMAAPDLVQGGRTEAGATIGQITLEGTVFLVLFAGLASAMVGAAFYLATRAWLPQRRRLRALAFGGLELVVFGTTVLDAGNPDFTILGRPVLNVVVFGSLFLLHGVLLVVVVEPAGRLVAAVGGGSRWRETLVNAATVGAAALTATAAIGLGLRGGGALQGTVTMTLLGCAAGLAFIDPSRARRVTRPALRAVGGVALAVIAFSGAIELVDTVTTIV